MGANQKNIKNIAMFTPPQPKRPTMNKINSKRYLQLIKVWKCVQQCVRWFLIRRSCNWRRNAKETPGPRTIDTDVKLKEGAHIAIFFCTWRNAIWHASTSADALVPLSSLKNSRALFKILLFPQDDDNVFSPRERHILDIVKLSSTRIQSDCQCNKENVI